MARDEGGRAARWPSGVLRARVNELGRAGRAVAGLAACLFVAGLTTVMPQAVFGLLVVLVICALWQWRPRVGLVALWTMWLVIPGLRRVIDVLVPSSGLDPLAVLPFIATAAVAALELAGGKMSRQGTRVLAFAVAGMLVGLPLGARTPTALTFGLLAYGGVLSAFVIGYLERTRTPRRDSLQRTLTLLVVPLAAYGVAQYVLPLGVWDEQWIAGSGLTSIRAPGDEQHIRVFSSLNSPATFAGVLTIAIVMLLARRRLGGIGIVALLVGTVALGLTYVRSAIPALVLALIALAVVTRGRAAPRLLAIVGVMLVAAIGLGSSTRVGSLVVQRVTTLGSLGKDRSANEREQTFGTMLPAIVSAPLGHGIGSAGEPARLAGADAFSVPDSGYLSISYQTGPVGFVLILYAIGLAVAGVLRARPATAAMAEEREIVAAALAALLILAVSVDVFYGMPGAILWYLLGQAVAIADLGDPRAFHARLAGRRGAPPPRSRPPRLERTLERA